MFNKVLVGIDLETGGRDALALARQLVSSDGELINAHIRPLYPVRLEYIPDEHVFDQQNGVPHTDETMLHHSSISVGRGLHELAEREGADLLVVGSASHGILGRVMIGDGTRESINGAPCAVAIAPAGYADRRHHLDVIGLGYNDTVESKCAVACARRLADEHQARLSAMEVVNYPTSVYLGGGGAAASELTEPMMAQARERLGAIADVEPCVAFGNAPEELARYSGELDLLVVGSRDYGPLRRLTHSSVSRRLVRSCRCPLLILTRGARARTQPDRNGACVDVAD